MLCSSCCSNLYAQALPFSPPSRRPPPLLLPPLPLSLRLLPTSTFINKATKRESTHLVAAPREEEVIEAVRDKVGNVAVKREEKHGETILYSFAPYALLFATAFPGAETLRSVFGPVVDIVKTLNLPQWLVHWGHPGNMAVVLFAMGGYGSYLGFRIRLSDDAEEKAMAKNLHPKLLAGMFFFFALGATGGVIALLTSDKPILESPHAVTGLMGLSLLTVQASLPALFEGSPGLRPVHGLLGSSIMTLFLIHAALGLQLGLSF